MSTVNVSQTRRAVKQRAELSLDMAEADEVHAEIAEDAALHDGIGTQSILFSKCHICLDTGIVRVDGHERRCWCEAGQTIFHNPPDEPVTEMPDGSENGDLDEAWREASERNAEREAEIESETRECEEADELARLAALPKSKRLDRVQRNAASAYPEVPDADIDKVLREAATAMPIAQQFTQRGAAALSTTDLVTLLLGEQTPILASRLISQFVTLAHLCRASLADLKHIKGMTNRKAGVLQCALELASRRINETAPDDAIAIKSPADAAEFFGIEMRGLDHEEMRVMLLNTKNHPIGIATVYKGSVHTTVIRVSELFKEAIRRNVPAIIVAHNHPSGDPTPSPEDVAVTGEIVKAGKLLDIDVLDHLVIGDGQRFVSLKERGLGF